MAEFCLPEGPVSNSGTIAAAASSTVILDSVLSTGAIDIGANGSVDLLSTVIGNISYFGADAGLIVKNSLANGGINGQIQGAAASDTIDLTTLAAPYSATNSLSWQQTSGSGGVLSLLNNSGQTIEALNLGGTFTSANFAMSSDGSQGTLIEVGQSAAASRHDGRHDHAERHQRRLRNLRPRQQHHPGGLCARLRSATTWQVAGLGGFDGTDTTDMLLRDRGYGRIRNLRRQQQQHHRHRIPWARSDRSGRSRASATFRAIPAKPTC